MKVFYDIYESPVGPLVMAATETGLAAIGFTFEDRDWREGLPRHLREGDLIRDPAPLTAIVAWLDRYFAGETVTAADYDGPLDIAGTDFQKQVWTALTQIAYGRTTSYGALAKSIGKPDAVRAVGAANGANPLPILVPCHRVVGSTGKLIGFGGGLWRKQKLLDLEQGGVIPLV